MCIRDRNKAQFSLWAMMNSPLIVGCDIRDFVSETSPDGVDHEVHNGAYDVITNDKVIALNQDPLLSLIHISFDFNRN